MGRITNLPIAAVVAASVLSALVLSVAPALLGAAVLPLAVRLTAGAEGPGLESGHLSTEPR